LALPFGISFFTFHALSYLIDVYRRDVKAERNLLALALYITMFPQLIAGPIVRFKTIVGELHGRRETMDGVAEGIRIFVIGLAQKTLIANTLALPADRIFALPTDMVTAPVAWIGAIAYSLQLYFDLLFADGDRAGPRAGSAFPNLTIPMSASRSPSSMALAYHAVAVVSRLCLSLWGQSRRRAQDLSQSHHRLLPAASGMAPPDLRHLGLHGLFRHRAHGAGRLLARWSLIAHGYARWWW
jgi:hypothetical protein